MILTGKLVIRCCSCGAEYEIDLDSLDDEMCSVGEFGMGDRIQHEFCGEMECDACNESMSFKVRGFEYPAGAKEYQESESEGCDIIKEPYTEVEYIPESLLSVLDQILYDPQAVYNLEAYEFEQLVADVYRQHGFDAAVTRRTHDGGKDIIATCEVGGVVFRTYFECKRYASDNPVGVDMVDRLYGVLNRDRIDKGIIVASSYFTRDAIRAAQALNGRIELVDYQKLQKLIRRLPLLVKHQRIQSDHQFFEERFT